MSRARFQGLIVALLGMCMLAFVSPTLASKPNFIIIPVDNTFEHSISELCGFPVIFNEKGTLKIAEHFDKDDNLSHVSLISIQWRVSFTNPANGTSFEAASPVPVKFTFESDGSVKVAFMGLNFLFHVAGQGLVFQETGKIVFDENNNVIFSAGPHSFHEGDAQAFCNALATP